MELVDGRTLKDLVRERGPLPPDVAVAVIEQILRALGYAHKRGIVHRDVKPQNVIIDEEGQAKVADFGIARAGDSEMTETGTIIGTVQYLSPEQAQGQPVDRRSDLYSAGVVLYELLTGRVPFDGESAVSIAIKQINERPVPPGAARPGIPPALEAVVMRALEKDPARRFQSAEEFIAALRGRPPRAARPIVMEPTPGEPWDEERALALVGVGCWCARDRGDGRRRLLPVRAARRSTCRTWSGVRRARRPTSLHQRGLEVTFMTRSPTRSRATR